MIINNLFFNYLSQRKGLFVLYLLVVFLTFPAETLVISRLYSELFSSIRKGDSKSHIYIITGIIVTWLIIIGFYYAKSQLYSTIIPDYLSFIRKKIFTKTIEFYKNNYQDIKIGKFITRVLGLARIIKNIMISLFENIFPLGMAIIIINIYFFFLSKGVSIIAFVGFIITLIVCYKISNRCIDISCDKEKNFINMSEKLHDSFSNLMNVYLNNEEKTEIEKNQKIEVKQSGLLRNQYNEMKYVSLVLSIISAITFICIIGYAYNGFRNNNISSKNFINILVILIGYFSYLIQFSRTIPDLFCNIGIIKNSRYFLDLIFNEKKLSNTDGNYAKGAIYFKNIYFKYPEAKKYIFDKFNFEVKNNEKIAVLGGSGSGKTTLIKLLLKMYKLDKGKILINGKDIQDMDTSELRKNINYINQRTILFNDSILKNMKYGNTAPDKKILAILKKYKLHTVFSGLDNYVYEQSGVNGSNLSLGMQKVTMIIRGILRGGATLVYDEPLAGLDSNTRKKIIKLILDFSKNKTIIIITHSKEIVPYMDRIININDI